METQAEYAARANPAGAAHRSPTCWINYRAIVVPDPMKPMGPNLLGELLWPVDVQHNVPHEGWTCVGFSLIAPAGWQPPIGPDALAAAAAGR